MKEQNQRLTKVKNDRDNNLVLDKLSKIEKACHTKKNLVPLIIDAVESYATLEEIVNSMKKVFGEWTESNFLI